MTNNIEQLFDEILPTDFHPSPLFNDSQLEVFKRLRSMYRSDDWVIMAGCALTAFFDPEKTNIQGQQKWEIISYSALFVIASGSEGKAVTPYIFVLDTKSLETCTDEFLISQGRDFIIFNEKMTPDEFIIKFKNHIISKSTDSSATRKPINQIEKNVSSTIIENNSLIALHEVAPSRLVPEAISDAPSLRKALRSSGPIDIVIYDISNNTAVVCIEVDGRHHRELSQKSKDSKKTNLINRLGLPLLRILPDDIYRWNQKIPSTESIAYTNFIKSWVRSISRDQIRDMENDKTSAEHEKKRQIVRDKLGKAMYGKKFILLSQEQRESINTNELVIDISIDEYFCSLERSQPESDQSKNTEPMIPVRLEGKLTSVGIDGNIESGISAQGIVKTSSMSKLIKSPRFFLSHPHLGQEATEDNLRNLALTFLCRHADRILNSRHFT